MRLRALVAAAMLLLLGGCGPSASPAGTDATAAVAAARSAPNLPTGAAYTYLGQAPAASGGELGFVEAAGGGRYVLVRLERGDANGAGGWHVQGAGPVWDQPVVTGEVHPGAELAGGAWQQDPLAAAERQGMAFGLPAGAAWGQPALDGGGGATVFVTVSQAQGTYEVFLRQAGETWGIIDVEPRGGVARRSGSFDVSSPALGATVSSPLRVAGKARVFESAYFVELRDASGHVLVHRDAQAPQDASGWGTVDLRLAYSGSGPGRLVFGYISPRDGSRVEDVVVPVVLGAK